MEEVGSDTTPPVITLADPPGPVTIIPVGGSYGDAGATCIDDPASSTNLTSTNNVDTSMAGSYVLIYSCTDAAGNVAVPVPRIVIVGDAATPDTTTPIITLTDGHVVTVDAVADYTYEGATCTRGVVTLPVSTLGGLASTDTAGVYTVTYSCTDTTDDETVQVTQIVIVKDAARPILPGPSQGRSGAPSILIVDSDVIIGGKNYLLAGGANTLESPHDIVAGQDMDIVLTAYATTDIAHFTIYLNLHGDDVKHSDSDTYVKYDQGAVNIRDPHGFISDASIAIEQDGKQPIKKTVTALIGFDGKMGLTNMVMHMWNENRKSTSIQIFNALDIKSEKTGTLPEPDPEPELEPIPGPDPEPKVTVAEPVLPAPDPEPGIIDGTCGTQPLTESPDDAKDVLFIIRAWSGFENELATDDDLLQVLNLDCYDDAHIPTWVMTELAVLVSKGSVTIDEFVTALAYVLENV